jgi:hypothetical protein
MKVFNTILILALIISCSNLNHSEEVNVVLEKETGWLREYNTYFKAGSEVPYTGKFISISSNGSVTIDFKNGKMDGNFVRLNEEGDTTEYMKYENGRKAFHLNIQYEDGNVIHRRRRITAAGSTDDEKIFNKVKAYMLSNDHEALDRFLNPLYSYKPQLNSLAEQFGHLNSIKIIEIVNEFDTDNKREDIRAKMILKYEDIQLYVSFLIVKDIKLKGQAIKYKPVKHELISDNKVVEILDNIDNTSSHYKFLNTRIWPDNNMIYIKNYLIEVDEKKMILELWYRKNDKDQMKFKAYHVNPKREKFEGMYWN